MDIEDSSRLEEGVRDAKPINETLGFPIVGVGASAGGLESLEELFAKVPVDSGMAFVVVQHLSPDFKSVMDELLARRTQIPIQQAEDGLAISPDRIYLIPPKKEAILADGRFRLRDKEPKETLTLPIDHFFRSLAQEAGAQAIAVVLSGSGSDGSRGIRNVHEAGGLVICESAETAKFDGMPLSARETGVVDLILKPGEISDAILQHVTFKDGSGNSDSTKMKPIDEGVELIFGLLHSEYGIDFSHYKASTVGRRIQRRLLMQQFDSINEYAEHLRSDPQELNSLYLDLLIGVTRFFRDPEAYEKLEKTIIPDIISKRGRDEEIRIWVAGCATGEEAYSLAILFHEQLEALNRPVNVKIFATDVHKASLELAGAGKYKEESFKEVSESRLNRYFMRTRNGFAVDPDLRKMIVFAPHNVLRDAPFTKLDLISCRNLLIYFQPRAQKRALSLFHFGLKTGGILLLGPSESPGELIDEFDVIDGHWKLYHKRRDIRLPADIRGPLTHTHLTSTKIDGMQGNGNPLKSRDLPDASLMGAYDWVLANHMPAAILFNDRHELLHVFGEAEQFMKIRKGRPSHDVLDLFEDDLRTALLGAIQSTKNELVPVRYRGLRVNSGSAEGIYNVTVEPVENKHASSQQLLVTFQRMGVTSSTQQPVQEVSAEEIGSQRLSQDRINTLEIELQHSKENLQATVEELETSNEELQAANEELIASNEELQSTNEELHSVNEELYTVNAEYQNKINDLTDMTSDMDSLMESTDVATIFLDQELCIRKFTPQIGQVFKLMSQDTGRCIDSFAHHIDRPGLIRDIRGVLKTGEVLEEEVQDHTGRWMYMRVLPYRSKREMKGVVLTLIDINVIKQAQHSLSKAVKNREQFLAMLSHELRNPISAVYSASHLLSTKQNDPEVVKKTISVILRQAAHMAHLLDDLLDVSRMTQDKLELRRQRMNLRNSIQEAIESMQPLIDRQGQNLVVELDQGPFPVYGDPDRLRQVIINLLDNAIKYSNPNGEIRLKVSSEGDSALLQLSDEGEGISEEMMKTIFEPFKQSHQTRVHHDGGMGVGLSLVKFIIDGHDGRIQVKSEGIGKGSEFTIWLPLLSGSPKKTVDEEVESEVQLPGGSKTLKQKPYKKIEQVVVIEDQQDNREMLQSLLKVEGYDVRTAEDGEAGLRAILQSPPDAAVIDLGLPIMHGYDIARQVRSKLGEEIFLIALTGYGQTDDIEEACQAGFNEYLVKPLNLDRLLSLLQGTPDDEDKDSDQD
ncbi:chemotaxis protein CheB [Gimesia sp.]|uniref:chemotaxis protein CheB n=1 Tax=Gimesia sp. TaxID=2024833 RepID=UPI000C586A73|nr:chemotaxis protein CheB [Gimesia sp.]MAX36269.1 chemotaxis protein CheR [Gimesia sp.]HAH48755.1 chemotaxis protein CheR [Planctomycetaceae bacterium]HBL48245.1 chemotaxis protein CheR [Planctomycetaceae bacterium]